MVLVDAEILNRISEKPTFNALHVMYGTYEGITLSGKPSGTTYDRANDINSYTFNEPESESAHKQNASLIKY